MIKKLECAQCGKMREAELIVEGNTVIDIIPMRCPYCGSNTVKFEVSATDWKGVYGSNG